ncbi:Methyltransferase type 11 [Thalassoporum mexicanum PCC 7367]|nr:methyltransferase domain-containing protein [Pseudanabaena sp. PCC 7367]AFY71870.1 Methyltransferase type 11 [Pseudanabaena sp. PCC 7367]
MATILRDLSYRYQWLYDGISGLAALSVGGEKRFRHLFLRDITIEEDSHVLDLCCGSGQSTEILVARSPHVVGLDASPMSLARAKQNVPQAEYVEAFAEDMPLEDDSFDLVLTNTALHEMQPDQLQQILKQVYRVLKPDGVFTIVDFHRPTNWLFWLPLVMFLWLFETETAWQLIETDLVKMLRQTGYVVDYKRLYAGGSLQIIYAHKPAPKNEAEPEAEAIAVDQAAAPDDLPVAVNVPLVTTEPQAQEAIAVDQAAEAELDDMTDETEQADIDNESAEIIEYTEQIEDSTPD